MHTHIDHIFLICKGFDIRLKSIPSSGMFLADNLGTENFTTLNCSILAYNEPVYIRWSMENFRSISSNLTVDNDTAPESFYIEESMINITSTNFFTQSHLTILNLTSDLDGVVVFCGTHEDPKVANFSLRVYCK
jgi:hypothetical protein